MAGERNAQAAPGERPAPSACRWGCAAPLAGLESSSPPTRLYPAPARAVRRDPGRASHCCEPGYRVCIPFPRRACPFSALLDRATGSQCPSRDFWTGGDPTVRRPRACCDLARIGHRLNIPVFGNARIGLPTSPLALKPTRVLLCSRDRVERLVRDTMLSEKEAQLGCMFLH